MANLVQISVNNKTPRGKDALGILLTYSPLVRFLNGMSGFEVDGTDFDYRPVHSAHSLQVRPLGGSYTPVNLTYAAKISGTQKFAGGEVHIDRAHLADRDLGIKDIPVWFDKQLKTELRIWSVQFEKELMNGTGLTDYMTGLSVAVDGTEIINDNDDDDTRVINAAEWDTDSSAKSFGLNLANANYTKNLDKFLELLYYAFTCMDEGSGVGLLMDSALYSRIYTLARNAGILGNEDRSLFGVPVQTISGKPMMPLVSGAITKTEPDDTATPLTETTSLWIVSPGEMNLSFVTNSGLEYEEYPILQATEAGAEKWEFRGNWKIENHKSILRIRNIKLG
jgi:hypothetical protein